MAWNCKYHGIITYFYINACSFTLIVWKETPLENAYEYRRVESVSYRGITIVEICMYNLHVIFFL